MKRLLLVSILFVLISLSVEGVFARVPPSSINDLVDDYFGLPLCLPGMPVDDSCLFYGPAQVIAEMKAAGFTYPPRELPAATPPSEFSKMPISVAFVTIPEGEPAPIYLSFDDAVSGSNPNRQIDRGRLRFVSYINQRNDAKGTTYVQMPSWEWIQASPRTYSSFQGLEFFDNPRNDFGWIISFLENQSRFEPSYTAPGTGQFYDRGDLIQVYDTVEIDGAIWYQIGPEEWINDWMAKVVSISPGRPEGVESDRWIEVNLEQQVLLVYEDGQLVFATLIASGLEPFYTKPGVFQIYEKNELQTMQGAFETDRSDFYYLQDVPWTMFYDQAYAIHATYWPFVFGFPQSHGCVNLSPGDAKWLFDWAEEGEYVWIHDPSGQTPTDPDYYGPGAP